MIDQKRGKNMVMAGALAQLAFTVVMLLIWLWTDSHSAFSCVMLLAGGLPLWLMAALVFHCRQLERREAEELEQLAASGTDTSSIFIEPNGQELRPAAARVAFVDRWIVPIFTLLWAGYHAAIGILLIRYLGGQEVGEITNAGRGILLALVVGFPGFLLSRYATGMGRAPAWRLMRATGSYLLADILFVAAVLAALIGAQQRNMQIDLFVAYAGPIIQLVLAAELVMNFILDLYRPRVPGQEHRPSFDSRLLNLLAEPDRVGHSIAEALNYQFGFEVSKTWFYQLLSRAALPLLIFAAGVMFAMSSLVLVREGQRYVVLHWGKVDPDRPLLEPGLRFKWPWPIDTARRFETGKVYEILLGAGRQREPVIVKGREVYLWTEEHGTREELDFLLAVPPKAGVVVSAGMKNPPPPVNIIKLVVAVQYVIRDPYKFGYRYTDARKVLECLAYREMSRYCASATLDSPVPGGEGKRPEAIMTYGRKRAADELRRRIQQAADRRQLGVAIKFVGISAVHPPAAAAPAYEAVLEAERRMLQARYEAEAEANRILVGVAGQPLAALKLALAIRTLEELERLADNPGQAAAALVEYIRRSEDDVATLRREIEQERLMGLARKGEDRTSKQQLLQEHSRHLALLRRIQANLPALNLSEDIAAARRRAEEQFAEAVGEPAKVVAQAEAARIDKEITEAANARAFQRNLLAYQASPNMYMMDRWLDVWDEVLPGITKYVVATDKDQIEFWLNWESQTEILEGVTFQQEQTGAPAAEEAGHKGTR